MALSLVTMSLSQTNPMATTCSAVRSYFRENTCCGADATISTTAAFCPSLPELITYPVQKGNWTPCPPEEYYATFSAGNPAAVAAAVERLNAELPDGPWFPRRGGTRDFDVPIREREEQCQTRS